eukprot:3302117-Rhodomonas_salina.1
MRPPGMGGCGVWAREESSFRCMGREGRKLGGVVVMSPVSLRSCKACALVLVLPKKTNWRHCRASVSRER